MMMMSLWQAAYVTVTLTTVYCMAVSNPFSALLKCSFITRIKAVSRKYFCFNIVREWAVHPPTEKFNKKKTGFKDFQSLEALSLSRPTAFDYCTSKHSGLDSLQ